LLLQFKYNIHVFAAFKNHQNIGAIADALIDDKGKIKSYRQFEREALAISKNYNRNWLRTEYNIAVRRARTAHNLNKALDNTDLYPNWEYIKSKAADPREEHKKYYGKVFSLLTTVGKSVIPPNGENCQCGWRPTNKAVTDENPDTSIIKDQFLEDPTDTGRVFSDLHPYFNVQEDFQKWSTKNWNIDLPASPDKITNIFKVWKRVSKSDSYTIEHKNKDTGGFVAAHKKHGKAELTENIKVAKTLADRNSDAVILQPIKHDAKSADAIVSGQVTEFKAIGPTAKLSNTINRHMAKARAQGAEQLVITLPAKVNFKNLSKGIRRAFENDSQGKIKTIIFIYKQKLVSITRASWLKNSVDHWIQKKLKD
jgi:hypothetical protein